mgnify:CR=1 FL=1
MTVLFFQNCYSLFCNNIKILEILKINSVFRKLCLGVANIIVPLVYKLTRNNPKYIIPPCCKTKKRIIASLTTFPARVNRLWIVVESILRQSRKPDMLVLWLSKDQFSSIDKLPNSLLRLQKRGLIIKIRENDYKSHKKYYYVLTEFPQDHLLTLDDDIIYPENTIKDILAFWQEHPECAVGRYSNQLSMNDRHEFVWHRTRTEEVGRPSNKVWIGSGGGTIYPSGCLPKLAKDINVAMDICKTADDVWLNSMLRYNHTKIIALFKYCPLLSVLYRRDISLSSLNMGQDGLNLMQLNAVRSFCVKNGYDPYNNIN